MSDDEIRKRWSQISPEQGQAVVRKIGFPRKPRIRYSLWPWKFLQQIRCRHQWSKGMLLSASGLVSIELISCIRCGAEKDGAPPHDKPQVFWLSNWHPDTGWVYDHWKKALEDGIETPSSEELLNDWKFYTQPRKDEIMADELKRIVERMPATWTCHGCGRTFDNTPNGEHPVAEVSEAVKQSDGSIIRKHVGSLCQRCA